MAITKNLRVFDIVIHTKDRNSSGDEDDFISFPITKYDNILGRPRVVQTTSGVYGAPYLLLNNMAVEISEEEYGIYFSHIR